MVYEYNIIMGLSHLKGNSGYIGQDKRHETGSTGTTGNVSVQKHYLERKLGNFSPLGLGPAETPLLWYEPSIDYVTLAGSNVTMWTDKMGSGVNFPDPPSTTYRPLYDTTDSDFGGLPSIDFSLVNKYMAAPNNAILNLNTTGGFTVYVVAKVINFPGSTYNGLLTKGSTGTNGWGIYYYESVPGQWRFYVNGYSSHYAVITGTWSDTNLHIWKMRYSTTTGEGISAEIIGPTAGSANLTSYTTAIVDNTNAIYIGEWYSTSYDINCKYGDIIFYNRPLTTNEQIQTEIYLKAKYNIN